MSSDKGKLCEMRTEKNRACDRSTPLGRFCKSDCNLPQKVRFKKKFKKTL